MIGNTGIDQSQNLPFAIKADIVEPEVGFLNGSKVTIQEIDPKEFVGIQVSPGKFEKLPKSTRPVKVAFRDFRQWLSKCRPVKKLEHLFMGKGKRILKKQNWVEISDTQAEKALNATGDNDKKKKLASDIQEFNTDLKKLSQKKMDVNSFKIQNDKFREKYKTIMAIADGDLTSARLNLREGLVIVLPPATEGGDPQYVVLKSKSLRVRKHAAKKLAKIFKNSEAYTCFRKSIDQVYNLEDARKKLKSSLTKKAKALKKEHKGLINERAEDLKSILADQQKEIKKVATSEMNEAEVQYTKTMNVKIEAKATEANALSNKITVCQTSICDIQNVIAQEQGVLRGYENVLMRAEKATAGLTEGTPTFIDKELIAEISQDRTNLLTELENKQNELGALQNDLKKFQADHKQAMKDLKMLTAEKEQELIALYKARKKVESRYDDRALELSKLIDQDVKTEQQDLARMLSGSGAKK